MASQPLKSTLRNLVFFLEGIPSSNKTSSYPVRMENGVPVVQQNQSTQPLQIQPSMLTQVRHKAHCLWNGGIISNADVQSIQSDELQINPVELEGKRQSLKSAWTAVRLLECAAKWHVKSQPCTPDLSLTFCLIFPSMVPLLQRAPVRLWWWPRCTPTQRHPSTRCPWHWAVGQEGLPCWSRQPQCW